LYKSFGATVCCLAGVKLLALFFFFLVAAVNVGIVAGWRVDRACFPCLLVFAGGELRSRIGGALGASPTDVISAMALSLVD
jgi:hypothetical protein